MLEPHQTKLHSLVITDVGVRHLGSALGNFE